MSYIKLLFVRVGVVVLMLAAVNSTIAGPISGDDIVIGTFDAGGNGFVRVVSGALPTFGDTISGPGGGYSEITGVGVQSDNAIVVTNVAGQIWRIDPTTVNTITYDNPGSNITGMAVRNDDTVFIAGNFGAAGRIGVRTSDVQGFTANSPQGGFGTVGPNAIAIQSNNNVVFFGDNSENGDRVYRVAGADVDVKLNGPMGDGGYDTVTAIATMANDKVVIGNSDGKLWVHQSDVTVIESDSGPFGNIVEIKVMSGSNNIVVVNDNQLWVREGDNQDSDLGQIGGIATTTAFTGLSGTITALALQSDNDMIVGTSGGQLYGVRLIGTSLFVSDPQGGYGPIVDLAVLHAVPEPASWTLAIISIVGLLGFGQPRGRKQ